MTPTKTPAMTSVAARHLSGLFLSEFAARPALLARFLQATGLSPADLRAGLGTAGQPGADLAPDLALAIVEFALSDEPMLLDLCAALDVPPGQAAQAQLALGGGPGMHWT
jgi:hypothetical protein